MKAQECGSCKYWHVDQDAEIGMPRLGRCCYPLPCFIKPGHVYDYNGADCVTYQSYEVPAEFTSLKHIHDTLKEMLEYWNGSQNERAMCDALEHYHLVVKRLLNKYGDGVIKKG